MVTTLVRGVTIRTHEHEFFIVTICTHRDKSVNLIIIRTHAHEIVSILSSTNGHEFDNIVTIRTNGYEFVRVVILRTHVYESVLIFLYIFFIIIQGRIQDFKLGGGGGRT